MITGKFLTRLMLCAVLATGDVQAQDSAIPETLIDQLETLAESENAEAMYHLGMLYIMALGFPDRRLRRWRTFAGRLKRATRWVSISLAVIWLGNSVR